MDKVATQIETGSFYSVSELAKLLHISEKLVDKLTASGALPSKQVTGKLKIPQSSVQYWIPNKEPVGPTTDRVLLAGSDDRLMHLVCSEAAIDWQRQGLVGYSPNGTRHGLRMLDQGQVDGCFINWGAEQPDAERHLSLLHKYKNHAQWIIVRCLSRSQGLIVRHHVTNKGHAKEEIDAKVIVENSYLRWAMRQDDSGTERLLTDFCKKGNISTESLTVAGTYSSGRDAVAAVNAGVADVCCGTKSTALEYGLDYVPITDVALDLVLPKRIFCQNLVQKLLTRIQETRSDTKPNQLDGYNVNASLQLVSIDASVSA